MSPKVGMLETLGTSAAAEVPTVPSEPNQKAIDAGAAALLRLPDDLTALAKATATQLAKDGGIEDTRECMAEACALVTRLAKREAFCRRYLGRLEEGTTHGLNSSI